MTTATETKPVENGHLTKADEYRRELSADLAEAMDELEERRRVWDDLKADTKEAKADHDAAQREVNRIGKEIKSLRDGTFQPRLVPAPQRTNDAPVASTSAPVDEGAAQPIEILQREFSLTERTVELIKEAKFGIKTVGDLERTIRENEWWSREIKGLGPTGINKVVDALVEFRKTFPWPEEGSATNAEEANQAAEAAEQSEAPGTDTEQTE